MATILIGETEFELVPYTMSGQLIGFLLRNDDLVQVVADELAVARESEEV